MKKFLISLATALLCAILALLFPETPPEPVPETIPEIVTEATEETVPPSTGLTVHFIDVDQADCALLECDGEFLLIDGGNVGTNQKVVSYLTDMGVDELTIVCTHGHKDHVGGLPAVLSVFDADVVYSPVTEYSSKTFRDFVEKTEAQGLSLTVPSPSDQFNLGSATVTFLGPVAEYEEVNDTSIVLKVTYGESDFLFTGDMELTAENEMLDYWGDYMDWECEVLKVGHHCSDTSTGYRFIYEVNPEYAIISVGKDNSYGLPSEVPLYRLRDAGAVLMRTDRLGHIVAHTDGEEVIFTWENHNAEPANAKVADPAMAMAYGNKRTKKFHTWNCRNLPSKNNLILFDNYTAAVDEGYTPCDGCMG